MLHPIYLLLTEPTHGLRLVASERKTWRPVVVIPRELCVFESMPCAGLAWHERSRFARTQAARLAPFSRYGCNAAVVNNRLMLWFWDEVEVSAAIQGAGLESGRLGRAAETLRLRLPGNDGEWVLPCAGGNDTLTLVGGAIVRSRWQRLAAGQPDKQALDQASQLLTRPWSRELIGAGTPSSGARDRLAWLRNQRILVPLGSAALVTVAAAYAGYWGGVYLGTNQRLSDLEKQADVADRRIGDLASLRQSALSSSRWVDNYTRLAASVQLDRLLEALSALLERNGVVIRELEIRQNEVRLAISSAGGDIDLPRLLEGLSALSGVSDAQLRDNVELAQAGFSFRVPGYMALMTPAAKSP